MSPTGEEPTCPKFQPNIFDPSRCHECLRQKHLHSGGRESAEATPQPKSPAEPENAAKTQTDSGIGQSEGGVLRPIASREEERDTCGEEDSDGVSAASSYCDVRGDCVDDREPSLCILSAGCSLYICDRDDNDSSADSCLDHSDYQDSSGSGSAEDEYQPARRGSPQVGMTRLDPPPHRPNPRAWMEEAQSRDGFSGRSGYREDTPKRESGYFSLGRAAGASLLRSKSPSGPYRHYERGHPIYSTDNVDPKDTIPFRNPSLGVASEMQKMTVLSEDLSLNILSPHADETAVDVEAQVGPRSPSPTPFKIAESLASTGRKGFSNSYNRGSPSSPSRHSGRFDTSRRGSPLQSRSSSPSRGNLPFGPHESAASIGRIASAGRGWTRGLEPGPRNSPQGVQRTHYESGTLPRNFKSFATSMKSQSSTMSHFRSALRKTEVSQTANGYTRDGRSSSPSRRDHNSSGQMSLRKTELPTGPLNGHRYGGSASLPTQKASVGARDRCGSSPQRRNYCSSSQSLLRESESALSLYGHSHHGRCGSPIREGYDIESQVLLRNEMARNGVNDQAEENQIVLPSRKSISGHSVLHKSESSPAGHRWDWHNQGSSPRRKDYQTSTQHQLRKTQDNNSLHSGTSECRSSSPQRRSHEEPSQSRQRSHDSAMPLRDGWNAAAHRSLHKTEAGRSLKSKNHSNRHSAPSGNGYTDVPSYSAGRNAAGGDSFHGKNTHQNSKSDSHYSSESTRSHRSSSVCPAASPSRQTSSGSRTASLTRETRRSPRVVRSGGPGHEEHRPSLRDAPSRRPRTPSPSPPPPPQVQMQQHTSSQSSMESSESGPPLLRPSGRNREEYVMMADVPKVKITHQREAGSHTGPAQIQRPPQRQELFKPASHSLSKHPFRDREDTGDAEWHQGSSGYLSRAHWRSSLQRPDSPAADDGRSGSSSYRGSGQMQAGPISLLTVKIMTLG